jgi:hypothetical protein
MSDIWENERWTMNIPKANLDAAKLIAKKMFAGNTSAYINLLIFNGLREAVEKGLIEEFDIEEPSEGAL